MKKASRTIALLLLVGLVPSASMAQAQIQGEALGRLYLSASPDHHAPFLEAGLFEPFSFYLVADIDYGQIDKPGINESHGMTGWEVDIIKSPDLILTMAEFNPLNALDLCDPGTHFCVGLGTVFQAGQTPTMLVKFTGIFVGSTLPTDLEFEFHPANPSQFNPPAPGWYEHPASGECNLPDLTPIGCRRPFARFPRFRINCRTNCKVGTAEESWGTLKAMFWNEVDSRGS